MDVTNENFLELLPQISETIQNCDFISIDTELSGLMRENTKNRFDLTDERFAKIVESSKDYFILQFGLSCFTQLENDRYSNRTYNFYIFPQPHEKLGDINRTLSLQAHAIQFLSQHNFDFNKLFKHGVSYLTFQEKKSLTARLKSDSKARSKVHFDSNGLPKIIPLSMQNYFRIWVDKIKNFIETKREAYQCNYSDTNISSQNGNRKDLIIEATNSSNDDVLEIPDCSTHSKRNIMKQVLECLPINDYIEIGERYNPDKNETYLTVTFIDKKLKVEKRIRTLTAAKGFLEVLELIILNKKPLVGHNLYLDIIQIINQFMEPLSEDYVSFKETCNSLFPLIYDTKYIAHSILDPETLTNNQSRLNDLYLQLMESDSFPRIQVEHLGEFFDDKQLPHQAGYDAYMSGYCFIVLCEGYIREKRRLKHGKKDVTETQKQVSISKQRQVLDEFSNKIHLSYSYDLKYFNLGGDEEEPSRNHVFYIEHPNTWSLEDIFQAFKQFGGVIACRLNCMSALCALRNPEQTALVEQQAQRLVESSSNYRIFSYETYLDYYKPKKKESGALKDAELCEA